MLRPNTMLTNYGSLTQGYGIPSMHGISKGRGGGGGGRGGRGISVDDSGVSCVSERMFA